MNRRRGSALMHVLVAAACLSAVAVAWLGAYRAASTHGEHGIDRARARALAEAAWTRARLAIERGEDPSANGALQEGTVRVTRERRGELTRFRVIAAVVHLPERDPVASELILDVVLERGRVVVKTRREVSG